MEKRVYGQWADIVFTISHEDSEQIHKMVPSAQVLSAEPADPISLGPASYPVVQPLKISWVPFTPSIRSFGTTQTVEAVQGREGCLFIGEPHMIAVRSCFKVSTALCEVY